MSVKSIWLWALLAKIILAALIPLSNDEAYYWVWSHHLQLSYFDHPPFVAWLFKLAHPLEAISHLTGALRIPAVIFGHLTLLVVIKLLEGLISTVQLRNVLLVLLFSPFFGVGSLIVTPDIPYIFFWTLSLLFFRSHLNSPSVKSATLLGASLGLGFCSKYLVVVFVPIAIAYLLRHRRWQPAKLQYLGPAILAGLLFSLPVLFWNHQNDWASFRFQLGHGLDKEAVGIPRQLAQLSEYLGGQLALLSPLVLFTFWKPAEPRSLSFLRWFGWGSILFFAWTSLRSPVEANWPIAGHLSLLIIAAIADSAPKESGILPARFLSRAMMTVWGLATAIVVFQSTRPSEPLFGIEADRLKTYEFVRFKELEPLVGKYRSENVQFFASSYQMAAALSVALKENVGKLKGINRIDFYDFHESGIPMADKFVIALETQWPWPSWIEKAGYKELSRDKFSRFELVLFERKSTVPPETR
ncbi:MAG: glycosyltransferase family 39 protein [Bdellovibrionales bacterium]|nr:glycosyltransferase family 39 protein [Bdellovibrionales bacterium]